jgi:hypothetical protein
LKPLDELPTNVFFIVAGIDIVAHEQLTFIERVKRELEERNDTTRKFEAMVFDKGFHGWLSCMLLIELVLYCCILKLDIVPIKAFDADRKKAYDAAVDFIVTARDSG